MGDLTTLLTNQMRKPGGQCPLLCQHLWEGRAGERRSKGSSKVALGSILQGCEELGCEGSYRWGYVSLRIEEKKGRLRNRA